MLRVVFSDHLGHLFRKKRVRSYSSLAIEFSWSLTIKTNPENQPYKAGNPTWSCLNMVMPEPSGENVSRQFYSAHLENSSDLEPIFTWPSRSPLILVIEGAAPSASIFIGRNRNEIFSGCIVFTP